jgi:hypothetical protein
MIDTAIWTFQAGDIHAAAEIARTGARFAHDPERKAKLLGLAQRLKQAPAASSDSPGSARSADSSQDWPSEAACMALSPDGKRLAYWSGSEGERDRIVTMDLDPPMERKSFRTPRLGTSPLPPRIAWISAERIAVGAGGGPLVSVGPGGAGLRRIERADPEFARLDALLAAAAAAPGDRDSASAAWMPAAVLSRDPLRIRWTDPEWTAALGEIRARVPGRAVTLLAADRSRSRFLFVASGGARLRYFIYNRGERELWEVPLPSMYN